MFMPFEKSQYMCMALVLFSETCRTAAYKRLCVTDEYLEQFFVCFSTLLRMYMN